MGAYNTVLTPWRHPDTNEPLTLKVQFKYGDVWQLEYQVGDTLKWGGNQVGRPGAKSVVVDGAVEGHPPPGVPEDFEVHIVDGKIAKVIPSTGMHDFVTSKDPFIVVEE